MLASTSQQTFAAHITVCAACGREVQGLSAFVGGEPTHIMPCGHPPNMRIIANPKLPKTD